MEFTNDDNFLNDYSNEQTQFPIIDKKKEKELEAKAKKEMQRLRQEQRATEKTIQVNERMHKIQEKAELTFRKKEKKEEEEAVDEDVATITEKRALVRKIGEFNQLFKKETKDIFAKFSKLKNPSVLKLKAIIEEMDVSVSCESGMNEYISSGILDTIQYVEGYSKYTKYNVVGLSAKLKENPNFKKLCSILYLKYNSWLSTPPEMQLMMVIFMTASIQIQENRQESINK